jgi:hypothetical protein
VTTPPTDAPTAGEPLASIHFLPGYPPAGSVVASYPPEWDDEEDDPDEDYIGTLLIESILDLTGGAPFGPAPFDTFRDFLPERGHVVYHLIDRWGDVLYIGQTRQARNRMRAHWSTKPWIGEVTAIRLIQTVGEYGARTLELDQTKRHQPPYSQVTRAEVLLLDRMTAAHEAAANGDAL